MIAGVAHVVTLTLHTHAILQCSWWATSPGGPGGPGGADGGATLVSEAFVREVSPNEWSFFLSIVPLFVRLFYHSCVRSFVRENVRASKSEPHRLSRAAR